MTASLCPNSEPDTSQMIATLSATSQLLSPMRCRTFIISPHPGCGVKMLDHCQILLVLSGSQFMLAKVLLRYPGYQYDEKKSIFFLFPLYFLICFIISSVFLISCSNMHTST